eukprot:g32849.t1
MTEDDIIRIEKQIGNLQVMHKVQKVETELEQLELELQQLLPVSAAISPEHFTVNPKQVHGQADDLPAWCNKISTLLKSMAILLATLGGKEIDIPDTVSSHDHCRVQVADPMKVSSAKETNMNIGRLSLDLFMLGYFQLLEMNMTRSERKFRHILCYEMFDRLGSHSWELIRKFHKVVMEEIESGKRDWADGFEDIKQEFFGDRVDAVEVHRYKATTQQKQSETEPAQLSRQESF